MPMAITSKIFTRKAPLQERWHLRETRKRDKTGSTMNLCKHLEKCHVAIYHDLNPPNTSNPYTHFYLKAGKFIRWKLYDMKKKMLKYLVNTNITFAALEHPYFVEMCFYFVQCELTLPSAGTFHRGVISMVVDEKVNM